MIRCPPRTAVAAPAPNRRPKLAAKVNCYNRRFSAGQDAVKRAVAGAVASYALGPARCQVPARASLQLPSVPTQKRRALAKSYASALQWDYEAQALKYVPAVKMDTRMLPFLMAQAADNQASSVPSMVLADEPSRFILEDLAETFPASGPFYGAAVAVAPADQALAPTPPQEDETGYIPLPAMPCGDIALPGLPLPVFGADTPAAVRLSTHSRTDSTRIEPTATVVITRAPAHKPGAAIGGLAAALSIASLAGPAMPLAVALAGVVGVVQGARFAMRAAKRRRVRGVYRSRYLSSRLMSTA